METPENNTNPNSETSEDCRPSNCSIIQAQNELIEAQAIIINQQRDMVRVSTQQAKCYLHAGNEAQRDYEKLQKKYNKLKRKSESRWFWWLPEVGVNIK